MTETLIFSVVIPTFDRPERLRNCIETITKLNYPNNCFEVIIVNDGGTIPLEDIITHFQSKINITLINNSHGGPGKARNTGAAYAQGKYLAFTDDDCTPGENWLKNLADEFNHISDRLIGGKVINALTDNLYSTASQLLIDYLYSYYNSNPQAAKFFTSNNFALPRKYFQEIGGFNTSFPLAAGEDREFCDRVLHQGYPMFYAQNVEIYHSHYLTFRSFWRQQFNYGRGAFCFRQISIKRNIKATQFERISFYFNLLMYPFYQKQFLKNILLALLFILSQMAITSGWLWEKYTVDSQSIAKV